MNSKILTVVVDLLSIFLVVLPWIVLQLVGSPYRRGFFCDDESIKYPLLPNTVTNAVLTSTSLVLSFLIFVVVEAIHCWKDSNKDLPYSHSVNPKRRFSWRRYVMTVYSIYLMFLFGLAIQQTLTNIGKFSIGRLRPHFLSACRPDFLLLNCTSRVEALPVESVYTYITIDDSACTNTDKHALKDARLSFPSGHSSLSTYVAVFLALYLQARLTWKGSRLLRHFLQAVLIYLAFFVCLSRISDYKHHWSDVLCGAFIGVMIASLTSIHVVNKYREQASEQLSANSVQENGQRTDSDGTGHTSSS